MKLNLKKNAFYRSYILFNKFALVPSVESNKGYISHNEKHANAAHITKCNWTAGMLI